MYRNILYVYVQEYTICTGIYCMYVCMYVWRQNTQFVSLANHVYYTKYLLKLTMGTQNGRLHVKAHDEIL